MGATCMDSGKTVSSTDLRANLKEYLKAAAKNRVVLIENRRQSAKYLVDKEFLDTLLRERESIFATLEVLAESFSDRQAPEAGQDH